MSFHIERAHWAQQNGQKQNHTKAHHDKISGHWGHRVDRKHSEGKMRFHTKDQEGSEWHHFSIATHEAGRQWNNVFTILGENYFQYRFLYPAKLSVKCGGK